jgi:hypothetical protein
MSRSDLRDLLIAGCDTPTLLAAAVTLRVSSRCVLA